MSTAVEHDPILNSVYRKRKDNRRKKMESEGRKDTFTKSSYKKELSKGIIIALFAAIFALFGNWVVSNVTTRQAKVVEDLQREVSFVSNNTVAISSAISVMLENIDIDDEDKRQLRQTLIDARKRD